MKDKIWLSWEYFAQEENGGKRLASHVVPSRFVGISYVRSKSRALKFTNFQIVLCSESTTPMASASRVAAKILNQQWRQPKVFLCRRFGRAVTIFIVKEHYVMLRAGVWALVRDQWRKFRFCGKDIYLVKEGPAARVELKPCFVFIWEQTATCATYSINWLVFITQMKCLQRGTDWVFK